VARTGHFGPEDCECFALAFAHAFALAFALALAFAFAHAFALAFALAFGVPLALVIVRRESSRWVPPRCCDCLRAWGWRLVLGYGGD